MKVTVSEDGKFHEVRFRLRLNNADVGMLRAIGFRRKKQVRGVFRRMNDGMTCSQVESQIRKFVDKF